MCCTGMIGTGCDEFGSSSWMIRSSARNWRRWERTERSVAFAVLGQASLIFRQRNPIATAGFHLLGAECWPDATAAAKLKGYQGFIAVQGTCFGAKRNVRAGL